MSDKSISPKKYSGFVNGLVKMGHQKAEILVEASGLQEEVFIKNTKLGQGISAQSILTIILILSQLDIIAELSKLL